MTGPPSAGEAALAARVLATLLQEDYAGLRSRVDGDVLRLPGRDVALTTPSPGFVRDREIDAAGLRLDDVLAAVRALADPSDDVAAFADECRAALAARGRLAAAAPTVRRALGGPLGPGVFYETLAAYAGHPVHPLGHARTGLSDAELERYAPEHAPSFTLRWARVPRSAAETAGTRPAWWPEADAGDDVFPVHPLTAPRVGGVLPWPGPAVRPTLSMRTVAAGPLTHLKLPLPTSTLGLRNRRTIAPATLADGARAERLLRAVLAREPGLPVLLADEQTYGHAGDPMLGYLVRRFPPETLGAHVVPVAALLAEHPDGGPVIAQWDVPDLFGRYLDALFAWNVTLFRYGIALEAHQQNVSLVLRGPDLRLLIKDNDGAMVDPARCAARLGPDAEPVRFDDARMLTRDPEALARVFVTITLHLCAAAPAFGLAERGLLPLRAALGMVRDRLDAALGGGDAFLRARTLDAARLPGKAMLTAGTLVAKARTGAADINKHYGPDGPNYLRDGTCS
ncbi:IucA/IucC family protein [Actinomadura flavalba]|uniref:IucA/IucC family protein n=1 Tax=Actinomadura flavalba TaxID=1120938 RepID=UPI00037D4E28|nr:IucA/IucC family protein [Actinomadura flavalba]